MGTSTERPDPLAIPAGRTARGRVAPPPSKSVTHRALNLTLLSGRPAIVEHPLLAEDTRLFLEALAALGWSVEHGDGEDGGDGEVRLAPPSSDRPDGADRPDRPERARQPDRSGRPASEPVTLFCGNAGTMFRFLAASLTAAPTGGCSGPVVLDGTPRLRERPVGPLLDALRSLGARVACRHAEGHAPLVIEPASLRGGRARLDAGESSQYLSALLMACLRAPEPTRIEVPTLTSTPYVEITRDAIRRVCRGAVRGEPIDLPDPVDPVAEEPLGDGRLFTIVPARPEVGRFRVEGDLSAACYPAAAAALTGGEVEIVGVRSDSAQGDRRLIDLLATMGAEVTWTEEAVTVRGGGALVAPGAVDLSDQPDQVPTLAALAPFARGTTRIENVAHLRIKESDRLRAMAEGLARLGVPVEERPDGLVIDGCWAGPPDGEPAAEAAEPVVIDPFDDHRIAMSFALVGLRRPGVSIAHPEVVAKSYPAFWDDLFRLLGA